jgi:hypothetical protein
LTARREIGGRFLFEHPGQPLDGALPGSQVAWRLHDRRSFCSRSCPPDLIRWIMKNIATIRRFTLQSVLLLITSALYAQTPQSPFPISGPTTITQSGYYRLTRNVISSATSGAIITIQAHNVIIDLNSFFIVGPNNPANTVIGISANEFGNLTIMNGTIAFCQTGIQLGGNGSATTKNINQKIENMRISNCFSIGVLVFSLAPGSIISNCQFSQIGGSTVGGAALAVDTFGGVLVQNNIVTAMIPTSGSSNTVALSLDTGDFAVRNVITGPCTAGVLNGKYQNNLFSNVTTPFIGGIDAGGNN